MKTILFACVAFILFTVASPPAPAQELAPVQFGEAPRAAQVQACPVEPTLPTKPAEISTQRSRTPAEPDHPLYIAGIVLYPVGQLLEWVIFKPIIFVFDHPFTEPSQPQYQRKRTVETQRSEYADLHSEYEGLREEYDELRREYEDLRREYEDLDRQHEGLQS